MRHWLTHLSGKTPLRIVLILPFVLQIVAAVGLTGYLSLRNGQIAVNRVADDLRQEITNRIRERLQTYLALPLQLNQLNASAIEQKAIVLSDLSQLEDYLLAQIRQFDQLSGIAITLAKPDYLEVVTFDHQTITVNQWNTEGTGLLQWNINPQGNRSFSQRLPDYDHRQRQWYRDTLRLDRPNWTKPFTRVSPPGLIISANQPIYNEQGEAIGVLGTDLSLLEIRDFLNQLRIGKTGETFIVERDGSLIASSTEELPFRTDAKSEPKRLLATESEEPLIQVTAQYLIDRFGSFETLSSEELEFQTDGGKQFVQVMPLQDPTTIDWLVVVVVPESDFMEQIQANRRLTILLCLLALLVAIAVGVATARWITKPILQLSQAAEALAAGDWERPVSTQRTGELGVLSRAFNHMRQQLQQSHDQLAAYSHGLEQKNQELETLEADLRKQLNLFLHAVSHDLRNPVIGTLMVLNHLKAQAGDTLPLTRLMLERMIDSNQRQLDLINSLIDTHAAELWGIVLHPQSLALHQLVTAAIADLQPILDRNQVTIHNCLTAELPRVTVDPLQLTRVYQNLVANAAKHNPPGLTVTLAAEPIDQVATLPAPLRPESTREDGLELESAPGPQWLYCTVTDDGEGLSPDLCDRLFDPYIRGKTAAKTVGLGLGLYLCQQIVQAHGGTIGVESQLGSGTTFWFTLPIAVAEVGEGQPMGAETSEIKEESGSGL